MKILLLSAVALISSLILFSCKKDNPIPPEEQPQASLTLEDVSCTEAWIKLSTSNLSLPADVDLYKGSILTKSINLTSSDTILYIDSLLPNQSYSLRAIIQSSNQSITSNVLPVSTMDTTSHNFTWQTWTFGGQAGSCVLRDVAIINENDIWAVGEIYVADTSQNGHTFYNAVHWDGNNWDIECIPYYYQGQPFYNPIQSIFAFGINDIWFCGNGVIHWDGNQYIPIIIPTNVWGPYQMNKIWGMFSNDLYVVGNNGNIAHYLNGEWSRIESGTTTTIQDIWGSESLILCAVSNVASPGDRKILEIDNNQVSDFLWNTDRRVQSIWFKNKYVIYTSGGGVFSLKDGIDWSEITEIPLYYSELIRGENYNNIWVAGDFGLLAHYNGLTWKVFNSPAADIYYACAVKGSTSVFVGTKGGKAIISQAYH